MSDDQTLRDSQQLVIDVFKGFRVELMRSYGNVEFSLKADNSQVTKLDVLVENTLRARLFDAFPEYGFRGEETGSFGSKDEYWLIDPIDGTSSFIRGLPNCTNMAALIRGNRPVASVIYNFVEDVLYTAIIGEGAFKNGQRIHVSNRTVEQAVLDNLNSLTHASIKMIIAPYGVRVLQPLGACGRSFSLVAEGKLEGAMAISIKGQPHDLAPGALLVEEAGGEVIALDSDEWSIFTRNFAIVTPNLGVLIRQEARELAELVI